MKVPVTGRGTLEVLGRDKAELSSSSLKGPKWGTPRERMTPKAMQV